MKQMLKRVLVALSVVLMAVGVLQAMVACGVAAPTAPTAHSVRATLNIQCTTDDGRSGYMVTAGDKTVCQPADISRIPLVAPAVPLPSHPTIGPINKDGMCGSCLTSDNRSGYMITSGFSQTCVAC